MDELWFQNNDIPIDVLSRLPTKALLSLKCVSKEFHSLISDCSILPLLVKRAEQLSGFFFQERFQWCDDDIKAISYIPVERGEADVQCTILDFLPESVVILASSNGLICCRSCFPSPQPAIYVCNPLNKEWVSLQWPAPDKGSSLALAFDPFRDLLDVSTNFRVVTVCQTETDTDADDYHFSFDIYSSAMGVWRKSVEICQCNHNLFKNKGIFIGGVLYWLTDGDQILMFDLENELALLIMVPLPSTQFKTIPEMCIGESEGRLHYVLISEDGLQLWVLEDHFASQWEFRYSISLEKLEEENSQYFYHLPERVASRVTIDRAPWMNPLAFKDGMLFMRVSADIYLCQIETGKMKKVCSLSALGSNSYFSPIVLPYTMSLVPLGRA
ncbi:unnamed protein product [Ilex paraguariensis]|uniref:F-box domain-containing protein n=1 Tax=Ilex paraguariensis TaxID=185542 RepID=A0ABC8UX05_9AQUA